MATELAKAYVQIIPSAQGIQDNIGKALNGEADSAGKSSGLTFAAALGGAAKKALGALAIGKTIADGITGASEFETAMAKVGTLYSGTDFEGLGNEILDMSSQFGLSATTLAEAAYSAESAGVSVEDLGSMLSSSAMLAIAGFTDVDTALSATAKTMNAYGMTGEESIGKVQNVLMQTQNLGITTVGELGASLANVTPTASALGVAFEQVGAAMAQMTASGVGTAQATTQLRSAMTELGKAGTKADTSFRAAAKGTQYAGMSFQEAMASGADLGDVFGLMQTYADKSGKSMVDLWGSVEAGNAAMLIASDVETFDKNLAAMGDTSDNVGKAYEQMAGTLSTTMAQLKESAKNFMTTLFQGGDVAQSFNNMLSSLGNVGERLIQWLTTAIEGLGEALPGIMSGLLDFGAGILQALGRVNWIELGVAIVNGLIGAMGTLGTRLIELFSSAVEAIASGEVNFGDIGTAIWNGVTSIITTAGEWLKTLFEAGKKAVSTITFGDLGQAILDGVKSIITSTGEWLSTLFGAGRDAASGEKMNYSSIGTAILDGVKGVLDSAGDFLSSLFASGRDAAAGEEMNYKSIGDAIKTAVNLALNYGNFLSATFEAGAELIKGINWTNVGQHLEGLIVSGLDGAASLVSTFSAASSKLISSIGWDSIGEDITSLVTSGLKGATSLVDTFVDCSKRLTTSIGWESIGTSITDLVNGGLNGAQVIITTFTDCAKELLTGIGWKSIGIGLTNLINAGIDGATTIVSTFTQCATELLGSIGWKSIGIGITNLINGSIEATIDILGIVKDAGESLLTNIEWSTIGTNISDFLNKALVGAADTLEAAFDAAKNFITKEIDWSGAAKTIQEGLGEVWTGITGLIGGSLRGAGTAAEGFGNVVGSSFSAAGTAIEASGQAFANWVTGGSQAKSEAEELKQALADLEAALTSGKKSISTAAENISKGISDGIKSELSTDAMKAIGNGAGTDVLAGLKEGIDASTSNVTTQISSMCTAMVDAIAATPWDVSGNGVVDKIKAGIDARAADLLAKITMLCVDVRKTFDGTAWDESGKAMVKTISSGVSASVDLLKTYVTGLAAAVLAKASEVFSGATWEAVGKGLVQGIADGVKAAKSTLETHIVGLSVSLPGVFVLSGWSGVGQNIVSGIVSGINSASSTLYTSLKSLAKRALQAAKAELGIASPSKVMADQVGRWIPAGIAEGIRNGEGTLTDALSDMIGLVPTDVTGELLAQGAAGEIAGPFGGSAGGDDFLTRITDAVRHGMEEAQIVTYMDGELVTQRVNQRLGNQLTALRYAP